MIDKEALNALADVMEKHGMSFTLETCPGVEPTVYINFADDDFVPLFDDEWEGEKQWNHIKLLADGAT